MTRCLDRRTRGTGKDKVRSTELFNDGKWTDVPPEERLKLSKADAQIWIALHNLVTDPKCRARYRYDDFRRETVTRLNRHFNDVLFDQASVFSVLNSTAPVSSWCAKSRSAIHAENRQGGQTVAEELWCGDNGVLQIPMLQDLQRIVAEVVFMVTPASADVTQGRLVIEQVSGEPLERQTPACQREARCP